MKFSDVLEAWENKSFVNGLWLSNEDIIKNREMVKRLDKEIEKVKQYKKERHYGRTFNQGDANADLVLEILALIRGDIS